MKNIIITTMLCLSLVLGVQGVKGELSEINKDYIDVDIKTQTETVVRSMEVPNPYLRLSHLTKISTGGKAFMKIFSGLSVADVQNMFNDLMYIKEETKIRTIDVFINSPGGDAFAGLALADWIEHAQNKLGITFKAHASGIVASAAVPVFAVCKERYAMHGTVFMVHEASLWKWPGRETASDIRSQGELMDLLRNRYITKLVRNSKLSYEDWKSKEGRTTWFSSEEAGDWGLLERDYGEE